MPKVVQEFYCNDCSGYFTARIDAHANGNVKVVCPNCGRGHPRTLVNGHIKETSGSTESCADEIIATKSSYSKKPRTSWTEGLIDRRNGRIVPKGDSLKANGEFRLRELWLQNHGDK